MSQQPATEKRSNPEARFAIEANQQAMTGGQKAVLLLAVIITVLLRVIDSPWLNFGAMIALTMLCGSISRRPMFLLLPLGVRLLTDMLIQAKTGYSYFPNWPFDYSAYVVAFGLGCMVSPRKYVVVVGSTLASIVVYFLISNLGFWVMWPESYPRSWAGLALCYTKALPFVRGTLLGNLVLAPVFFAAWNYATDLAQHSVPSALSVEEA